MSGEDYRRTATSADGTDYDHLVVPDGNQPIEQEYSLESYSKSIQMSDDGYYVWHLYLQCNEVYDVCLPLEANPREPSRTAQVTAMQKTLERSPEDFVKKNNGVVLFATDVNIDEEESMAQITFSDNEGICNGGHTYFAIYDFADENGPIDESGIVHLECVILPSDLTGANRRERIIDIAGARNNNNRLETQSEADFLGYYDEIKDLLQEENIIEWHEGDSQAREDAFDSVHLIRILKTLDIFAYYHPVYSPNANTHKSLATSRSRTHNAWVDEMEEAIETDESRPLHYLLPLINDVFSIRDKISHTLQWETLGSGGFRRSDFFDYLNPSESKRTNRENTPDVDNLESRERELLFEGENLENEVGIELKDTMEVLFIGLFRTNIFVSPSSKNDVIYTGWYIDPIKLWEDRCLQILRNMVEFFNDAEGDPRQFIRTTAPFSEDLFQLGYNRSPPKPVTIYERELEEHKSGEPYQIREFNKVEDDSGTHVLILNEDETHELRERSGEESDGDMYIQTDTLSVRMN